MKLIKLSNSSRRAKIDDCFFEEISKRGWFYHLGYARSHFKLGAMFKTGAMHRIILPPKKGFDIDHKNRNGLDNRRCNLRYATRSQNLANSKLPVNNTSGFKGVRFEKDRGLWLARIKVNQVTKNLGRYKNKIDAAKAYNAAAIKYFGEFSRINKL